jgi:hypothetical protein
MGRVIRPGTVPLVKKANRRHRRNCRSAPAIPATVTLTLLQREVHHRVEWYARVKWDPVDEDVAGRALNVEGYQVFLRATDAAGTPVEVDGVDHDFWHQFIPATDPTPTMERAVFHPLPKPLHNHFQTRIRVLNRVQGHRCWSAFTSWTSPQIADPPSPPQPLNVRIFDNSVDRIILDWNAPTADYPTRGTVSGTSGTATLTGTGTKFTIEVGAGAIVKVGGNTYTVKKVTSDTALTLTTNLSTSPSGAALSIVDEHFDVDGYLAQIAKATDVDTSTTPDDWSAIYMRDRTTGTRKAFKIPAADQDLSYIGRVFSVGAFRNRSRPVPGTTNGNSDPDANGSAVSLGVTVDNVKRRTFVTWTIPGTVQAKHYDALWTADRKYRPIKVRARVGRHDATTHPVDGTPGGRAMIINLRWHDADETQDHMLMGSTDRLKIPAGTHRDTVWATDFAIQSIAEDEVFSLRIAQVGDTRPGSNLVVILVLEEDQETNVINVGGLSAHGHGYGKLIGTAV